MRKFWKVSFFLPYDLDLSVYYDVHLSCNLAFSANEVAWSEYSQLHLQNELVQKFGLASLQKCYLMDELE